MKNSTLFKKWLLIIAFGVFGFSYSSAAVQADTTVLVSETFATSLGSFTPQSLVGAQVWAWNSSAYAKISGFVSSVNNPNDDWLVSPAIDLTGASSIYLNFLHAHKYGVDTINTLQLMVSDSYTTGTIDPGQWTAISFPLSTQATWNFVNSGYLSLEAYKGKANVHFAFRYRSTATASATWEVKNVTLKAIVKVPDVVVLSETFNKVATGTSKAPLTVDASTSQATMDALTVLPGWTGSKVYAAGSALKMGSSSVAGILTTPALDLSSQSGKFNITFKAMAWSADTTHLRVYVDNVLAKEITGMNADTFYVYKTYGPYEFTGGSAASKIKFTTSASVSKNCRFYLDSIVITQAPSTNPTASGVALPYKTETGTTQAQNVTILAKYLTGDLSLAFANKVGTAFQSTTTTVTAVQAMASGGFAFPVYYSPSAAGNDTATITITGGGLAAPVVVTIAGNAYSVVSVANLAALRAANVAAPTDITTIYKVTGECVVSWTQSSGNTKYIQDATGGLMVYDVAGKITTAFVAGNGMTGVTGTLLLYGNALELVPIKDVAVSSTGNIVAPVTLTIPEAKANKERYESSLVLIKGLTKPTASTFWGTAKTSFNFTNGLDTIVIRTNYTGLDFMSATTAIPTSATDYAGILCEYNGTVQLFPRSTADIGYVSSVKNVETNAGVYGSNGMLHVKALQGQLIEVYTIMGRKVLNSIATDGINEFQLSKNQILLVKVGNRVAKVVM